MEKKSKRSEINEEYGVEISGDFMRHDDEERVDIQGEVLRTGP